MTAELHLISKGLIEENEIIFSETTFPHKECYIDGKKYYRFMDNIMLPCTCARLSEAQILTVNRMRSKILPSSTHKPYNDYVKQLFRRLIPYDPNKKILEIGAGSFPLCPTNNEIIHYDIDPVCKNTLSEKEFYNIETSHFDLIFAVFVFHFKQSEKQLNNILRILDEDGVFTANICSKNGNRALRMTNFFSKNGCFVNTVDIGQLYDKQDTLLLISKNKCLSEITSDINNQIEHFS